MPDFTKLVRQIANERWDLPDAAAAIGNLLAETISRSQAGDIGVAEGVLSRSEVTFETVGPVYQLRLGGALLYGCKPDATPSNLSTAAPVVYDPTDPNQIQSTVDITAFASGTTNGAIWWSVGQAQTDLENRRLWAAGFPDGQITAMNTRLSPRVTFQTSADLFTPPSDPGTWYRFAAFDFPAAPAAPTVVLCHALDFGFENSALAVAQGTVEATNWFGQIALANRSAVTNSGRSYSVARMFTQFALTFLRTLDSTVDFDAETLELTAPGSSTLTTVPSSGVVQLDVQVAGNATNINLLSQRYRMAYWARVSDGGSILASGGDIVTTAYCTVTPSHTGATGVYNFVFSLPLAASMSFMQVSTQSIDTGEEDVTTRYVISSTTSVAVFTNHIGAGLADYAFSFSISTLSTSY